MKQTNLYIHQGTDYSSVLTLRDGAGAIFNPTGYTIVAKIKKSPLSIASVLFTASLVSGVDGTVRLTMDNAATALLSAERYVFSLDATLGSVTTRIGEGVATVHYTVL
jgi:hypothetical protein